MNKVQLLDCTLRDGMYVTDFVTPDEIKAPTVRALETAGVEVIELGFLKKGAPDTPNSAYYGSVSAFNRLFHPRKTGQLYAAIVMAVEEVPEISERTPDGIDCLRLAFFKKDAERLLTVAKMIKAKGYNVMLQPMRTSDYSESEILRLIEQTNRLEPFSFAMVDSFGTMLPSDIEKLCDIYATNINPAIHIGFHFHNNTQLAFANAITLLNREWQHGIISDASILGMGRGAGNLPVELICGYLNDAYGKNYNLNAIYDIYDQYFADIFAKTPWGYSLKHYVSAKHNVNPFYATWLSNQYDVATSQLDVMFATMSDEEKVTFKPEIAKKIYCGEVNK